MKEIYKTSTVKELFYEAVDGTTFKDKKECEKYENTAKCALLVKYKPLVVKETTEYTLYKTGNDEDAIDIVKLKSKEDIDTLMQLFFYYSGQGEYQLKRAPAIKSSCEKALETNDFLIIYRGYCDEDSHFYIRGTVKEIYENMIKCCCNETN